MILITGAQKTRTVKEVEVVIRKTEKDRDHEHDIIRIAVGAVEEKSREAGARKNAVTKTGAENDAGTEVAVKIELETNIYEVEVEVKKGS